MNHSEHSTKLSKLIKIIKNSFFIKNQLWQQKVRIFWRESAGPAHNAAMLNHRDASICFVMFHLSTGSYHNITSSLISLIFVDFFVEFCWYVAIVDMLLIFCWCSTSLRFLAPSFCP
jgi:hypothetical protein